MDENLQKPADLSKEGFRDLLVKYAKLGWQIFCLALLKFLIATVKVCVI